MKKVKNYMDPDLAKKKVARYQYWTVKDENGIAICSSDDNNPDKRSFSEVLDKIITDQVDVEVQVKYGTSEQSSRHNPPFFIQVNQDIEWIDPEEEETVSINGVPHKVDKQGHVNINLSQPEKQMPRVETVTMDTFRQEMEIQLTGLKKEYELKEEKWQLDLHNKLLEQTLKFKEMMLEEREARILEKEQALAEKEAKMEEKQTHMQDNLKGYLKQVPAALSGLVGEYLKAGAKKSNNLGEVAEKPQPIKRKVRFTMEEPEEEEIDEQESEIEENTEETTNLEETTEPNQETDEDLQDNPGN